VRDSIAGVVAYHDGTKHHYGRFAKSLGYLDWATQPKPFRTYVGARSVTLFPAPGADPLTQAPGASSGRPLPPTVPSIGFFLRHALGLSAWKSFRGSRWSLRVNPSSGNLHPTEGYVIAGDHVWHYAPDRHALEERCVFPRAAWDELPGLDPASEFLVVLTSIHWRESWKYGERAFRYCHHDVGHAIGALRFAAALCGWQLRICPGWSQTAMAAITGVGRDEDFFEAEREDPACVLAVSANGVLTTERPRPLPPTPAFSSAVAGGEWKGRASQLSEGHVQWTFIDEVAEATSLDEPVPATAAGPRGDAAETRRGVERSTEPRSEYTPALILQRRSAVAFDGRSSLDRSHLVRMLSRVMPDGTMPWDVQWWPPRIHLVLFVHRVTGLDAGAYLLSRRESAEPLLRDSLARQFDWERVEAEIPLWRLATADCRAIARRVSCDQDIAADGFFSLAMLAEFDDSLREEGAAFYRSLYWETGLIGQVLYLEAEAAGARATGIGCFFDDGVHELLGIRDHALQSLYHFTVGMPVDDIRLTTEPGYPWEAGGRLSG